MYGYCCTQRSERASECVLLQAVVCRGISCLKYLTLFAPSGLVFLGFELTGQRCGGGF